MDLEPKIREDMRKLGCKSDMKITLATRLYLYLVDEKLMYDTEYCYNVDIDTLYVCASKEKNGQVNIYIPIPEHQKISMEYVNKMQENICTVETGPTVYFAIMAGDFTTVIYGFTNHLVAKHPPEILAEQKRKETNRKYINSELVRRRDEIIDCAIKSRCSHNPGYTVQKVHTEDDLLIS